MARHLADDLRDYDAQLLVLTDFPDAFKRRPNTIVQGFFPKRFHFCLKSAAYRAGLSHADTVIFLDADTVISESIAPSTVRSALSTEFPPGLHIWKTFPADVYHYPEIEVAAKSLGFTFNRDEITYQERLCALRRDGREKTFLDTWDSFTDHLLSLNLPWFPDGTPMALAAIQSGIARHGSSYFNQTRLSEIFLPMRHQYPMGLDLRPIRKFRARLHGWPKSQRYQ